MTHRISGSTSPSSSPTPPSSHSFAYWLSKLVYVVSKASLKGYQLETLPAEEYCEDRWNSFCKHHNISPTDSEEQYQMFMEHCEIVAEFLQAIAHSTDVRR